MIWRKACLVLLGISLAVFMGSSCNKRPSSSYPVAINSISGIRIVSNPDFPRDGRFTATLTEEVSCGADGRAEGLLYKPLFFDVDENGAIYVMDYGDITIKCYDDKGGFLRSIGGPGQGPGEIGGTMAFFKIMAGGRLCILDFLQTRLMYMTTEGRYLSGFRLKGDFTGIAIDDRNRVFLSSREVVVNRDELTSASREVAHTIKLFRVESPAGDLAHIVDFHGETWALSRTGNSIGAVGGIFVIVWTVNHKGKLIGGYTGDYKLRIFEEGGREEAAFGRAFSPIKDEGFSGKVGQKEVLPTYRGIVVDDDDNLWIDLYQKEGARGFLYDVFSPDGIYCRQIEVDQKIERIRNGKIYSLVRPEDGYPSVKRYGMKLTPEAN